MLAEALTGLLVIGVSISLLHAVLTPARAIWHGHAGRVPHLVKLRPTARGYLAFLIWFVPVYTGIGLLGVGVLLSAILPSHAWVVVAIGVPALALMMGGIALISVNVWVFLFNKPAFLVPPPYRRESGAMARWAHPLTTRDPTPDTAPQKRHQRRPGRQT